MAAESGGVAESKDEGDDWETKTSSAVEKCRDNLSTKETLEEKFNCLVRGTRRWCNDTTKIIDDPDGEICTLSDTFQHFKEELKAELREESIKLTFDLKREIKDEIRSEVIYQIKIEVKEELEKSEGSDGPQVEKEEEKKKVRQKRSRGNRRGRYLRF